MGPVCDHAWRASRRGMGEYDCAACGAVGHRFWWRREAGIVAGACYATYYEATERAELSASTRNAVDRDAWERRRAGDDGAARVA